MEIGKDISDHFGTKGGSRLGDSLKCESLNLKLEQILRVRGLNGETTISYKTIQVLKYVDIIDIIGSTTEALIIFYSD